MGLQNLTEPLILKIHFFDQYHRKNQTLVHTTDLTEFWLNLLVLFQRGRSHVSKLNFSRKKLICFLKLFKIKFS